MLTVEHTELHKALGFHRNRLLVCLGADLTLLAPRDESDPFALYRGFVQGISVQWAPATDRATISLLAAARLLYGDLGSAYLLLDHFPQRPIRADRDAGLCLLSPLFALASVLPLPEALRDTSAWLAGSPQQSALRSWLDQHSARLHWNQPSGVYEFR
ncbi:MAG: hypothetical protein ABI972_31700 [Acidobacteriota bacterium]